MRDRRLLTRRQAGLVCMIAIVSSTLGAALCVAAALLHAPPGALPAVALVCVGAPAFGAWELPSALRTLRNGRGSRADRAVAKLRRSLDELPEVDHPLGL